MRNKINNTSKIIIVFLILLIVSLMSDITQEGILTGGYIRRGEQGNKESDIQLTLHVEGEKEPYDYSLSVPAVFPTHEEAEKYFEKTILEIEKSFSCMKDRVPIEDAYQGNLVKADWSFFPFGIIDSEGEIDTKRLENNGTQIQAQVVLNCGNYEKVHEFSFTLNPPEYSDEEILLKEIEGFIEQQKSIEGSEKILLPTEANGKKLKWSEKKEYITPQIIFMEGISLLLLWVLTKRKNSEEKKKKICELEMDYSDIVSQLSLLLGAGMTTRQAWGRIGELYVFKRRKEIVGKKDAFEGIVRMNRRFEEGESERVIYQKFVEEIPAPCYHKLMRILLGNLEKGTQGIANRLEEESRLAFEQRVVSARKRGEEASTKMLLPLMLMLLIVMGIVMLPALLNFRI